MSSADLSLRLAFDANNTHWDAILSLALSRFLAGEEPFVEEFRAAGLRRATDPLPLGSVVHRVTDEEADRALGRGAGWTALVTRYRNGSVEIAVSAVSEDQLAKAVAEIRARCPVEEPRPNSVPVEFWFGDQNCRPKHVSRRIDAPVWGEIARNYPAAVRGKVDRLVAMPDGGSGGRLLLWHGPPGTGKTTAIRGLARAWAGWCRTLFVVDPERFLGDAGYLMTVLLGADDHDDGEDDTPRWRLIVIEDADELLRSDAKREAGQSLSRLLNVADGFIGQGVNALILITTNEPLGRLHPAVVRPGRCLAEVEFPALSRVEAATLLDGHAVAGDLTLAEVYERRGAVTRLASAPGAGPTGQYL